MSATQPIRESVTTIDKDGSRIFLHPADVNGRFTLARRLVAVGLIAVYILLPWIQIKGYPAVFLDVIHRRFHLFGLTFATQDLWLGFFFITGVGFSLFFISAVFGRIWCGWSCPQTVFLEHIYRRIERLLEGDAVKRRQLDKQSWTPQKIALRGTKHLLFIFISATIAHIFLAYFVSIPELYQWMHHSPTEHWGAFVFIGITTTVFYFNFAWFREQLCLVICPYGRLQSALVDDNSLVIGYDTQRGEPRGSIREKDIGDCIDCRRCVQVCPTGIDIRQGLQIECIGCANCIDACDSIMDKIKRPRGLVRYDSYNGMQQKKTQWLRPRLVLYFVLFLIGISVMSFSASKLNPGYMSVVRMAGTPYIIEDTAIRNQYIVRLINKRDQPVEYHLSVEGPEHMMSQGFETVVTIPAMSEITQPLILRMSKEHYRIQTSVTIKVKGSPGNVELTQTVEFIGPTLLANKEAEQIPVTRH